VNERLQALLSLEGRVALVAGGSGGIGRAVCRTFAEAGASVVSLDRPGSPPPDDARALECDVRDSAAVADAVGDVVRTGGRLDILVHTVGVTRDATLLKLTDTQWRDVLDANLSSAFYLLRASAPHLRQHGNGAVVVVSSINGERGKMGQANYAASKAGLNTLARTAARELGKYGVRVNAVAPGWVDTTMTAGLPEEVRLRAIEESALKRLARPDDIAGAILFLCCDLGRHVTGQVIRVDGGQLIA
jgi:acetoacetyl-CoA reductase/3-oxoacyl-[acyl-carrier protein] reductase